MNNLFCFLLLATLFSCAHKAPHQTDPGKLPPHQGRIFVYWPRQWQSQWGKFDLYANDRPLKRLQNEGYLQFDHDAGPLTIHSRHFQEKDFEVQVSLKVLPGKTYYLKLDTEPKDLTLLSVYDATMKVMTLVNGVKSEIRLDSGKGATWKDVKNIVEKEKTLAEMRVPKKEYLGHHVLIQQDSLVAEAELKECCSFERVEEIIIIKKKSPLVVSLARLQPSKIRKGRIAGTVTAILKNDRDEVISEDSFQLGDCEECYRGLSVAEPLKFWIDGHGIGALQVRRDGRSQVSIDYCDKNFFASLYECSFWIEQKSYFLTMKYQSPHKIIEL